MLDGAEIPPVRDLREHGLRHEHRGVGRHRRQGFVQGLILRWLPVVVGIQPQHPLRGAQAKQQQADSDGIGRLPCLDSSQPATF